MKFVLGIVLAAWMLVSGLGCASLLGYKEEPKVQLHEVYVKDADLVGTTLVFVIDVENPNERDIKVDEITYKVFLSGKELTEAKTENPVTVPAKQSAKVEVPLPVKYTALLGNIGNILMAREVSYRIEGDAKLSFFRIPFSKEGKVELR